MSRVKDIKVKVIPSKLANEFVKRNHYSGKIVPNSKLHFGCFLDGKLGGVMSYGTPMDRSKVIHLVNTDKTTKNEKWNQMLELNRMAFSDRLPRMSESRCIAISFRMIKKTLHMLNGYYLSLMVVLAVMVLYTGQVDSN